MCALIVGLIFYLHSHNVFLPKQGCDEGVTCYAIPYATCEPVLGSAVEVLDTVLGAAVEVLDIMTSPTASPPLSTATQSPTLASSAEPVSGGASVSESIGFAFIFVVFTLFV